MYFCLNITLRTHHLCCLGCSKASLLQTQIVRAAWINPLSSRNNVFFWLGRQSNVLSELKKWAGKGCGFRFYPFIFAERFHRDFIFILHAHRNLHVLLYSGNKFFGIVAHLFG